MVGREIDWFIVKHQTFDIRHFWTTINVFLLLSRVHSISQSNRDRSDWYNKLDKSCTEQTPIVAVVFTHSINIMQHFNRIIHKIDKQLSERIKISWQKNFHWVTSFSRIRSLAKQTQPIWNWYRILIELAVWVIITADERMKAIVWCWIINMTVAMTATWILRWNGGINPILHPIFHRVRSLFSFDKIA